MAELERAVWKLARAIDSGSSLARIQHLLLDQDGQIAFQDILNTRSGESLQTPVLRAARLACVDGNSETLHWLLEQGMDEESGDYLETVKFSKDSLSNTVLHITAELNSLPVAKLYFTYAPLTLESVNNLGQTPLILAARFGHSPLVEFLLDCGANANAADYEGDTSLHLARKLIAKVLLLIERGCDFQARNKLNWIASDVAYTFDVQSKLQECARHVFERQKKERALRKAQKLKTRTERNREGSAGESERLSPEKGMQTDATSNSSPSKRPTKFLVSADSADSQSVASSVNSERALDSNQPFPIPRLSNETLAPSYESNGALRPNFRSASLHSNATIKAENYVDATPKTSRNRSHSSNSDSQYPEHHEQSTYTYDDRATPRRP